MKVYEYNITQNMNEWSTKSRMLIGIKSENELRKIENGANTPKINLSGVATSCVAVPFDPLEQGILYGYLNDLKSTA